MSDRRRLRAERAAAAAEPAQATVASWRDLIDRDEPVPEQPPDSRMPAETWLWVQRAARARRRWSEMNRAQQ